MMFQLFRIQNYDRTMMDVLRIYYYIINRLLS